MAEERKSAARLPGIGWLNEKLSRKMILVLLVLVLLTWVFSFTYLIHSIQVHTGRIYDQAMDETYELTLQVASFLEGSQGDYSGLSGYLSEHQLGCSLKNSDGTIVFQYTPESAHRTHLTASGSTTVLIPGSEPLQIQVWADTLDRHALVHSVGQNAFWSITLFNAAIFFAAAVLLYILIVAPIISLRRTMKAYSEEGALPGRSPRRDEVGKLQNTFADLVGILRAKEQSEHRMIASISHDLKTPLTSVLGYSERLMNAALPPEKHSQYIQNIHDKGLAIKAIVDEFDDYLDVGIREDLPMERTSAGALCDRLSREFCGELSDAGVTLSVQCSCPDAEILCSPSHMSRYFGNLIGNSIRHSGAEPLKLEVLCTREDGSLSITFRDNGVGVQPALLQQIFEPLYTSDRGRKVSGLGLAICRSIIQSHGGSVTAFNCPEGGLALRALIPLARGRK